MMKLYTDTRFLVVDDQDLYRNENLKKLGELGFDSSAIDTAVNGAEALEKVKKPDSNYEFFIVDLVMPVMNGLEFIENLRKIEKYKSVPTLVVSGSFDRSIILEVTKAGATSFLVKPVTDATLMAKKLVECAKLSAQKA